MEWYYVDVLPTFTPKKSCLNETQPYDVSDLYNLCRHSLPLHVVTPKGSSTKVFLNQKRGCTKHEDNQVLDLKLNFNMIIVALRANKAIGLNYNQRKELNGI